MLYQVALKAALPIGETAEFTHYILSDSNAEALGYADAFNGSLSASTGWKALFPTGTTFAPAHLSKIDQATGTVLETFDGTVTYVGTNGGGSLPPQCAMVVTLYTAKSGGSYRGRYYLPPLGSGETTVNGRFTSGAVTTAVNDLAAAHSAGIVGGPASAVVVYSRKLRTVEPVLLLSIGDVIDTQRRRRDKLAEARQNVSI